MTMEQPEFDPFQIVPSLRGPGGIPLAGRPRLREGIGWTRVERIVHTIRILHSSEFSASCTRMDFRFPDAPDPYSGFLGFQLFGGRHRGRVGGRNRVGGSPRPRGRPEGGETGGVIRRRTPRRGRGRTAERKWCGALDRRTDHPVIPFATEKPGSLRAFRFQMSRFRTGSWRRCRPWAAAPPPAAWAPGS